MNIYLILKEKYFILMEETYFIVNLYLYHKFFVCLHGESNISFCVFDL